MEFENGAVKCVKDCPDCATSAPTLSEGAIIAAVQKACGEYRHGASYDFEDIWNCIEAAFSLAASAPTLNNPNDLFCDLKTDEEKANFFLSGRGYATGVIARAIQNDVAMAYQRCAGYAKEIAASAPTSGEPDWRERFFAEQRARMELEAALHQVVGDAPAVAQPGLTDQQCAALDRLRSEMFDWLVTCTKDHIDGKIEFINRVSDQFASIYGRALLSKGE